MEEQATEYSRRYRGETSSNYQYPVVLGSRNPILTKPNQTKINFFASQVWWWYLFGSHGGTSVFETGRPAEEFQSNVCTMYVVSKRGICLCSFKMVDSIWRSNWQLFLWRAAVNSVVSKKMHGGSKWLSGTCSFETTFINKDSKLRLCSFKQIILPHHNFVWQWRTDVSEAWNEDLSDFKIFLTLVWRWLKLSFCCFTTAILKFQNFVSR
jgi:hypothetical protein